MQKRLDRQNETAEREEAEAEDAEKIAAREEREAVDAAAIAEKEEREARAAETDAEREQREADEAQAIAEREELEAKIAEQRALAEEEEARVAVEAAEREKEEARVAREKALAEEEDVARARTAKEQAARRLEEAIESGDDKAIADARAANDEAAAELAREIEEARVAREKALAEEEEARVAMEEAAREQEEAREARENAERERQEAQTALKNAERETAEAQAAQKLAQKERAEAIRAREAAEKEQAEAVAAKEQAAKERAEAIEERAKADAMREQAQQMMSDMQQAKEQYASAPQKVLETEVRDLQTQLDAAQAELTQAHEQQQAREVVGRTRGGKRVQHARVNEIGAFTGFVSTSEEEDENDDAWLDDNQLGGPPSPGAGVYRPGRLVLTMRRCTKVLVADRTGTSDPYCLLAMGAEDLFHRLENPKTAHDDPHFPQGGKWLRTETVKECLNPVFEQQFTVPFAGGAAESLSNLELRVQLFDWDRVGKNDFLGEATFHLGKAFAQGWAEGRTLELERSFIDLEGRVPRDYVRLSPYRYRCSQPHAGIHACAAGEKAGRENCEERARGETWRRRGERADPPGARARARAGVPAVWPLRAERAVCPRLKDQRCLSHHASYGSVLARESPCSNSGGLVPEDHASAACQCARCRPIPSALAVTGSSFASAGSLCRCQTSARRSRSPQSRLQKHRRPNLQHPPKVKSRPGRPQAPAE